MQRNFTGRDLLLRASIFFGLIAALCSTSIAATITVNSLADDVFSDGAGVWAPTATKCTLRMAIAASNEDQDIGGANGCVGSGSYTAGGRDTIVFTGLTGTITLANQPMFTPDFDNVVTMQSHLLVVRQSTTFSGPGAATLTIDGGHTAGTPRAVGIMLIYSVPPRADEMLVNISGLKFASARAFGISGGCMQSTASLQLSSVVFDRCISEGSSIGTVSLGGGLVVLGGSTRRSNVSMADVIFSNNKALLGTATSDSAGGGFALILNSSSSVTLGNVTVNNNEAQSAGGARITGARSVAIVNSSVISNQASTGVAGGLDIQSIAGPITLRDVTISGNSAGQDRGGLSINNSPTKAQSSVVATGLKANNNTATRYVAGALITQTDNVIIANSEFNGNTGNNNTGGLSIVSNNVVVMRDSAVSNNTVNNGTEAGMTVYSNGSVVMERLKIQGNTTTKSGSTFSGFAALHAYRNGAFRLGSSEISGNTSADYSMFAVEASYSDRDSMGNAVTPLPPLTNTVEIENVTVNNNTSPTSMVAFNTPGVYTISNSTIANNAVTGCGGGISGGPITRSLARTPSRCGFATLRLPETPFPFVRQLSVLARGPALLKARLTAR